VYIFLEKALINLSLFYYIFTFFKSWIINIFQFNVVDNDVTLIYFSELIFQKLNLDLKNLDYNIDPKLNRKENVGSQTEYLKLMQNM
tara:strand:- start:282 stop:542 length:261 start_codon:yes stop_codon:yes gene_type:complete